MLVSNLNTLVNSKTSLSFNLGASARSYIQDTVTGQLPESFRKQQHKAPRPQNNK